MLASIDKQFVLLLNPKTGTTALERAFYKYAEIHVGGRFAGGDHRWKHIDYRRMKRVFGDCFERNKCEIYAVVRDPIETLFSWYNFRSREDLKVPTHPNAKNYTGNITWGQFVRDWAQKEPPPHAAIRDPVKFVFDKNQQVAPINIYKYNDIASLYKRLAEHVGENPRITRINASPKSNRNADIDREWVMEFEKMILLMERYNKIPFAKP